VSVAIFWVANGTHYLMYSLSNSNVSHYTLMLLEHNDNINFLGWQMEMLRTSDQRWRPECTEPPFFRPERLGHVVACVEHCLQRCSRNT